MATITYYGNSWEVPWPTNPDNMIDGDIETFAEQEFQGEMQSIDGNTCDGSNLGTITKVELRFHGKMEETGEGAPRLVLQPWFGAPPPGDEYSELLTTSPAWSSWFDITNDSQAPSPWAWEDVRDMFILVIPWDIDVGVAYCSKIEIRVTYTTGEAKGAMQTGKYWGEPI